MSEKVIQFPPDFFILGGMKCGTTSLFNYLSKHPGIQAPAEKELHYYDIHKYLGQTLDEYLANFPKRENSVLSGEATPFYLTHPHCPVWMKEDFPQAKFIVVMRNPVDRFWSQYNQMKRYRHYEGSAEDAIEFELMNGEQEWQKILSQPEQAVDKLKKCSLLRRGCYAEQLARWLTCFDRDRFLLLFTEDLLHNRAGIVNQTLSFLGLDAEKNMGLDKLHHTQEYPQISDSLKVRLEEYYAPHNTRLSALVDKELPWGLS